MHATTEHVKPRKSDLRSGQVGHHVPLPFTSAALVIVAAEAAALATWVIVQLAGVDPVADRGGQAVPVTIGDVGVAALVAGLAAWAVRELMRRRGRATWWPLVGSTLLAVSILGPAYQADGASAVALIGLHVIVGAVLIVGLARLGARPA